MDRINIINNEIILTAEKLGKIHNASYVPNDSYNCEFQIYKDFELTESSGFITVTINTDKGRGFKIKGSLRKFWYGKRSIWDMDYETFEKCLKLIAKKLEINLDKFMESRVTYLEIGGNLRLPKEYEYITNSMVSCPRLTKSTCTKDTTYFKAGNRMLCTYNKLNEIYKHKGISKNVYEKISKNIFIMRFEHRLTTPSGTNLAQKMNTLYKIKANWDFLIDDWENNFKVIKFLHYKPEIICKKKFMTRTEFKNFAIAVAVKNEGLDFFNSIINAKFNPNHKSQERRNLINICKKSNVENSKTTIDYIINAVKNKADRMKRKSREL